MDLPQYAISIKQPWAWAIGAGFKDIENRSRGSIKFGGYIPGDYAIHASKKLTKAEYDEAMIFMRKIGVKCPRPDELIRSAIIGVMSVSEIVKSSPSLWYTGYCGLVISSARLIEPIPAAGELGRFQWTSSGTIPHPLSWMKSWPESGPKSLRPTFPLLDGL